MRYAKFVVSGWDKIGARQRAAWADWSTEALGVQVILPPMSKHEQTQRWLWRMYRETIPYTPFVEKGGQK